MLAAEGAEFTKANYPQSLMSLAGVQQENLRHRVQRFQPDRVFHADLVKKAGGDPNNFPKTFDGIIQLAAKINDPANGINGMAYDVHGWPDSWLFEAAIGQAGGRLLNAEGTDIAFDGPAGLNAMKMFRRFVTEGACS